MSAPLVLEAVKVDIAHDASDPGVIRIAIEKIDGSIEKIAIKNHVAVHQADDVAATDLEPQLGADAAASFPAVCELNDLDGITACNVHCAVARQTVGEDDLSAAVANRPERAFNRARN